MYLKYLAVLLLVASCKKEDAVYPYNGITRYVIKEVDIKAVIQNDELIIYWPPFQKVPDSITADIALQERASIKPASGTKVPFMNGVTYTVTAGNGTTQQYKLKAIINQPNPNITIDAPVTNGVYETQQGASFYIRADYLLPDSNRTRIDLVKANGQAISMNRYCSTLSQSQVVLTIPANIDTGRYAVKITSGIHTYNSPQKVFINHPLPGITIPWPSTANRGEQVTFNLQAGTKPTGATKITSLQMRLVADNLYYPVTIVSQAESSVIVQIPAGYPVGTYYYLKIINDAYPNGIEQIMGPAARRFKVN